MVFEVSGGAVGVVSAETNGGGPLATPSPPGLFPDCVGVKNRYFRINYAKI